MAENQPPIAILGAGLAGLMLGRLLELEGIDFVIFEREATSLARGYQGATLDIHVEDGQKALKEAGLFEEFKKLARYSGKNVIADKKGKVFDMGNDIEHLDQRPEIDRKSLRKILLASIPQERVRWHCKVKSVSKTDNGTMQLHFEDGSVRPGFRLVVGADGAWSKARNLVGCRPRYSVALKR